MTRLRVLAAAIGLAAAALASGCRAMPTADPPPRMIVTAPTYLTPGEFHTAATTGRFPIPAVVRPADADRILRDRRVPQ